MCAHQAGHFCAKDKPTARSEFAHDMYIFYAKHHEEIESRGAAIENEAGNDVNLIQVHPLR